MDQEQPVDQVLRWIDRAKEFVAVGKIVLALQNQKARQRAVGHIGSLERLPKVNRRGGAVDAGAGLVNCPVRVVELVACVLDAEVRRARGGVQLGHQVQDFTDIARRAFTVSGS